MMSPGGYGWMDYRVDQQLIAGFERLQENYRMDPSAPWELEARALLERRRRRVRTGPGHKTIGADASFSPVSSGYEVPDSQVYAVLVKEVDGAKARAREFRQMFADAGEGSPLEKIACAIHIAEADNNIRKARDLTYLLGLRLLGMPNKEQARAERQIIGHGLYQKAIGAVQPALF